MLGLIDWNMFGILLILILLLFGCYGLPYLIRTMSTRRIDERCRRNRAIVLSFDDGPGKNLTQAIVDVLDEGHARGTFFCLGSKINNFSEAVLPPLYDFNEVGSHSYNHLNALTHSPFAIWRDVNHGLEATRKIFPVSFFRPPYGKITIFGILQAYMNKCRCIWWTIDSGDTWDTLPSIDAVLNKIRVRGGGVVLLHDHDRPDNPEREEFVVAMTKSILMLAQTEGFRICTLAELLKMPSSEVS